VRRRPRLASIRASWRRGGSSPADGLFALGCVNHPEQVAAPVGSARGQRTGRPRKSFSAFVIDSSMLRARKTQSPAACLRPDSASPRQRSLAPRGAGQVRDRASCGALTSATRMPPPSLSRHPPGAPKSLLCVPTRMETNSRTAAAASPQARWSDGVRLRGAARILAPTPRTRGNARPPSPRFSVISAGNGRQAAPPPVIT